MSNDPARSTHARSLYKGRLAIVPPARDLRTRLGKASCESAPALNDSLCNCPRAKRHLGSHLAYVLPGAEIELLRSSRHQDATRFARSSCGLAIMWYYDRLMAASRAWPCAPLCAKTTMIVSRNDAPYSDLLRMPARAARNAGRRESNSRRTDLQPPRQRIGMQAGSASRTPATMLRKAASARCLSSTCCLHH